MKKFITVLMAVIMCLSLGIMAVGCGGTGKEKLIVYTEAGFAPFEYTSQGKIVGVDVDIMNLVGEKLDKEIVFENVAFDVIVDAVAAGDLTNVGAAGLSITPEREEKVAFSVPYYTASLYVIYKIDDDGAPEITESDKNADGIIYWDSLAGKNVGVQGGTTADLFLSDEIGAGGTLDGTGTNKTDYDSLSVAVSDIGLNIDAVIIDELPAKTLVANNEGLACLPLYYKGATPEEDELAFDEYAIAVTKGQTELLEAINEVLNELLKDVDEDGNNGIQQLVMKHLDVSTENN